MKTLSLIVASLAVAALSIAPANAEGRKWATWATPTGNCSTTTYPAISPVQCSKPYAHSYVECTAAVKKLGDGPNSAWWWCSSQAFKN
jgi:hypothetical protein